MRGVSGPTAPGVDGVADMGWLAPSGRHRYSARPCALRPCVKVAASMPPDHYTTTTT